MIIGNIILIIFVVAEILIFIAYIIYTNKKIKKIEAKKEIIKNKIKEQEEIGKQLEERIKKAKEHKEALAWCTKRCNEYKQEQNKKLIEVLNKI